MIHNPSRLYHQLIKFAGQYSKWSDWRHLSVMCWMMVGLIAEGSVNLTKSFTTNVDPDPVKASRLQHEQKTYRIEFTARTHLWVY